MVLHERRAGVLTITINRPAQKNTVDHEVAVQLAAAVNLLDANPELSVGVLTGAGPQWRHAEAAPLRGRRPEALLG
ncbi:enoyl-CoA hydratase-related protein [Streptomyces sp. BE133]|uniref:enoyl-CoA hydratase-related protein n=1 Tax=Streptomyces sp. BE133 TaxID=3002523 RepID=UPI002E79FB74|nr:enoyl-CoA hydratase-related protein [Streptomyces sp. BE133]MEE1810134.1 enoyl-CoA hydratase-related protein [Streptomyces sp. BE133]